MNGDWVSSGRSVRGGIRAFLLGAAPRERERSGGHRSWEGGANTEAEEDGKEGPARGGGAGRGSSTDTVRGPARRIRERTGTTEEVRDGQEEEEGAIKRERRGRINTVG